MKRNPTPANERMLSAIKGESTYMRIWRTVEKIPLGKVTSYGQIARLSGLPGHARLVGYALHNLPHLLEIPWQRVVNAQGRIAFPNRSLAYHKQKSLLEEEGFVFENGRIDLKRYGWKQ